MKLERTWEFGMATTVGGVIAALVGGPWWALGTIVVTGFGDAFADNVFKKVSRAAKEIIKSDPELHAKWLEQHPDMPL
jgi:dolichol kinase